MNSALQVFSVSSFLALSAHASVRPECEAWQQKMSSAVSFEHDTPALLPGRKPAEVLALLAQYPDEPAWVLEQNGKTSLETVQGFLGQPGCKTFTWWSVQKWVLADPAFDRRLRKKALAEVVARTIREGAGEPSLLNLMIRLDYFERAIEEKLMSPSDASYFELSRLRMETDRLKVEVKTDPSQRVPEKCRDLAKGLTGSCSEEVADSMLRRFQRETGMTSAVRRALVRWVQRQFGRV